MILLADENISQRVISALRTAGHEVWAVAEMEPGIEDGAVLRLANKRGALLLTEDKDFGELVFRLRLLHTGVILVRLAGLPMVERGEKIVRVLAEHGDEMREAFTVLTRGALRIRKRDVAG